MPRWLIHAGNAILGTSTLNWLLSEYYKMEKGFALNKVKKYHKIHGAISPKYASEFRIAGKWVNGTLKLGAGMSLLSAGIGGYNLSQSDKSWGNWGKFGINLAASALTYTPEPITTGFGISIGLIDAFGGFQNTYDYLDMIEQTEHKWLNLGIYLTTQQQMYLK
jgi:hypothetical protein